MSTKKALNNDLQSLKNQYAWLIERAFNTREKWKVKDLQKKATGIQKQIARTESNLKAITR